MKRVSSLIILIFLITSISAVETDFKDEYKKGETLIGKISGNFLVPPAQENVIFYRDNVKIPLNFKLNKLNDEFYLYASLPENSGDYSFEIDNVEYRNGTKVQDDPIVVGFSIGNETADFTVDPAFVSTSQDFSIKVQNLKSSSLDLNVNSQTLSGDSSSLSFEENYSLKSGDIEEIDFSLPSLARSSLKEITIKSSSQEYKILVNIISDLPAENTKDPLLSFFPSTLKISLNVENSSYRRINLTNIGGVTMKNISIYTSNSLNGSVEVLTSSISQLDVGSTAFVDIYIQPHPEESSVSGQITARAYEAKSKSPIYYYSTVYVDYLPPYVKPQNNSDGSVVINPQSCSDLGGIICEGECTGQTQITTQGLCCLDRQCKSSSYSLKWLGWLLLIICIGIVGYFYAKNRKKN